MNAVFQRTVESLAHELAPLVQSIKTRPEATRDNYAKWGEVITYLAKGDGTLGKIVALALIDAGAPRVGVIAGAKLIAGLEVAS